MSRLKRWLFANQRKVNADGTLKEDYIKQRLDRGASQETIDDYAATLKAEYKRLKLLDETDPETAVVYSAYDFFTEEDKRRFHPDGSLKQDYVEYAKRIGITDSILENIELQKKSEITNFNQMSEVFAIRGDNFGDYLMQSRNSSIKNHLERQKQLRLDVRNGEDIDALPFDVDPDDYYRQHGYVPNIHG